MRFLIFIFLALSAGIGLTLLADNPGYVLITRQPWSMETSLIVFILGLLAFFILFYILLRVLNNLFTTPANLKDWQVLRNRQQAAEDNRKGMTEILVGHNAQAEKLLTRRLADSSQPELNLLAAAWIAQQAGDTEKRDSYLQQASSLAGAATDSSLTAVGLVNVQLQEQAGDTETALAAARELHQQTPANPAVLRKLINLLKETGQWQELLNTLTAADKYKALSVQEIQDTQALAATQLLLLSKNDTELDENWKNLPRKLRKHSQMIVAYCRALADSGRSREAGTLILSNLKHEWSDELVEIYGLLKTDNPAAQLKHAESWLPEHPTETPLMLCMGRLAIKNQLWGMARSYLELAVRNGDSHEAVLELGWLLESLGATDTAMHTYKTGLENVLGSRPQDFIVPTQPPIDTYNIDQPIPDAKLLDQDADSPSLAYSNESK